MDAFWWFKENSIAGMGRPGFNKVNWSQLTFEEDLMLGWFGNRCSGSDTLASFRTYLGSHGKNLLSVLNVDQEKLDHLLDALQSNVAVEKLIQQVRDKTDCIEQFSMNANEISFQISEKRILAEIEYLKRQEISKIITLTEIHHNKNIIETHFEAVHMPIADLAAPQFEQVCQLAELIKQARQNRSRIVVHCMAGVGRTSTMLIAAHLILGDRLDHLKILLMKQNPAFKFTTKQLDFLDAVSTGNRV